MEGLSISENLKEAKWNCFVKDTKTTLERIFIVMKVSFLNSIFLNPELNIHIIRLLNLIFKKHRLGIKIEIQL